MSSIEEVSASIVSAAEQFPVDEVSAVAAQLATAHAILASTLEGSAAPAAAEVVASIGLGGARLQEAAQQLGIARESLTAYLSSIGSAATVADTEVSPPMEGQETNRNFGANERMLGVASDRTRYADWDQPPTTINYFALDTRVAIDLENDPLLVDFLLEVKRNVPRGEQPLSVSLAEATTKQVVAQTPDVDEDYSYHERRDLTLGQALQQPIMCIDRALAMSASLVMQGFEGVVHLPSTLRFDGVVEEHVDVFFIVDGEPYVAVTMANYAGRVLPARVYAGAYLDRRRRGGIETQLKPHEAESYFQPVAARH
ncbi:MAG TPA: hypothetical protein VLH86_00015 [Patescibacteria group bacterium]|nr:hypothetical protein [Patescibacteria group bacterium]